MTLAEDDGPEREGNDVVAAEYVLGALSMDERQAVARRIASDPEFARMVDVWEGRLAPLAAGYPEVEAPATVKTAIEGRLFASSASPTAGTSSSLWSSLAFWRALATAAIAALVIAVVVPYINPLAETPQFKLVASLADDGSDVKYLVVYDASHHDVRLSQVSGERASGKDFELWMIEGKNPPISMGVIPPGTTTRITVSPETQKKLAQGAILAVSLEPAGGSPTGQPTGPVVAAGDLKSI